MTPYRAPLADILASLRHVAPDGARSAGHDWDDIAAILGEAARFAESEMAPLNRAADIEGARFADGRVTTPKGWPALYAAWIAGGWNAVTAPEGAGGLGLPRTLGTALAEMWQSASMAFSIGPVLTEAAVDALLAHGTPEQRALYLPRLIAGTWTGTMNLTEPQAGSDLAAIASRADPAGDGSYRLRGQKIFITYGEHDLAENIVHFVLARLPEAPPGNRGLSLFLVPKFLPDADGVPGKRNDVACVGIEHKLGLKASPTCTMVYGEHGGAVGWLVGEPHKGLACMFTMMNKARLATGVQGVGIAERATQQAWAYALARRQGHAGGRHEGPMEPIVVHPDVRRNLMAMRTLTAAARAICHATAAAIDAAERAEDPAERARAAARAALLTPIAKAYATDIGSEVASLGIQVHGGLGYIEETGAAQHLRDARIAQIYEGTNGIQAIDLVMRKLVRDGGGAFRDLLAELRTGLADAAARGHADEAAQVAAALDVLETTAGWLLDQARTEEQRLAGATPFLRLAATALGAALLLRIAAGTASENDAAAAGRARACLGFHLADIAPEAPALAAKVMRAALPPASAFEAA